MTKKTKIIWTVLTSAIVLGGVGTGMYLLFTPSKNKKIKTTIQNKTYNGTLSEFKNLINYQNATTPIENFENFFEIKGGVADAKYYITNLDNRVDFKTRTETMVLKIKVSKSINDSNEEIIDKIFDINFTFNQPSQTIIKNKIFNGTLTDFKTDIGYQDAITPIQNFKDFFEVKSGVENAEYFITNLDTRIETKTMTLKIKVSKSFDVDGKEVEDEVFDVDLITNVAQVFDNFNITEDGILSIKPTDEWDYENWDGVLNIPTKVGETTVKTIKNGHMMDFFSMNVYTKMTSIVFEEDSQLQEIGSSAFYNSWNLKTNVVFPKTLKTIKDTSFWASSITGELNFPDSLEVIGNQAFQNCKSLTNITFGKNLKTISDDAFRVCESLTGDSNGNLEIPESVGSIGTEAFRLCNKIETITVSQYLYDRRATWGKGYDGIVINRDADIVDGMFTLTKDGVLSITDGWIDTEEGKEWAKTGNLVIPVKIKNRIVKEIIGGNKHNNFSSPIQSKIKTLIFEEGNQLEKIGSCAFEGSKNLSRNLDLSNLVNLTTIEGFAFQNCSNLINLDLSGLTNLISINKYAFSACSNLTNLDLSSLTKLETIGENAFQGCNSLIGNLNLSNLTNLTSIGSWAFGTCYNLTNLNLSGLTNLKLIGRNAFNNCSGLIGDINLLDSINLTSIGFNTFNGCNNISSITVSSVLFKNHNTTWSQGYWNGITGNGSNVIEAK
ncbi:MAG: leucine-rich repeat domain-containing protein [Mycoplasma sp.]